MSNLPVKKDNFLAEAETMDLSPLREKTFGVAVATGDPDGDKFLCTTIHGPYTYVEMLQAVGAMWDTHQHHAKAIVLTKDQDAVVRMLDGNTIDYIELHYLDLITEEMLGGAFDDVKEFTCQAGFIELEEKKDAPEQTAST